MPEQILSEEQIAEIEARADAATKGDWTIRGGSWRDGGVKLAGYGIRFVESAETYSGWDARTNFPPETPEGRQASADRSFMAHAREDVPALCNTVRALRAQYESAVSDFAAEINRVNTHLLEVEKEREAEREAHMVTIENLSETLAKYDALRDFRTRVINLCKEKAAEWELEAIAESERNPDLSRDSASRAIAVNELREAIENLDHKE